MRREEADGRKKRGTGWIRKALEGVGYAIGTGATAAGLFALPILVVEEALRRAFIVYVTEELSRKTMNKVTGTAGEKAAEVFAQWLSEKTGGPVLDLNTVRRDFPFADFLTSNKPISVKTFFVNGRFDPPPQFAPEGVKIAWERRVGARYVKAFMDIWGDEHPRAIRARKNAANVWLQHRGAIEQAGLWPEALSGNPTQDQVVEFLRSRTVLMVPSDHVQIARNYVGQTLESRYRRGMIDWPEGLDNYQLARRIRRLMMRVEGNAVSGRDLRFLMDVAKRLPGVQNEITSGRHRSWPSQWGEPSDWAL